ncbi:magnesium transporter CorA family protein [Belnapia rosea]|uniref:Magnesium transport protein CorA n=1 Tax=Belnapia rosea TaxID=938405 RepID=A0A1G6UFH3_9PROT|nr:magnesium transporter CorA family protein [Belnapia rosea]SDD40160.1 magnesium transporter [Belnapia rosea]
MHFRGRGGLLTIHPGGARLAADLPPDAVWLDLLEGTEEEKEAVARATGFRVPTLESLREIESSSRMSAQGEVLYLSLPVIARTAEDRPVLTPLGLVLSPHHLLTVRFAPVGAVEALADRPQELTGSFTAFVTLLEVLVDRIADALERIRTELDGLSHAAFEAEQPQRNRPAEMDRRLRRTLRAIGRTGDHVSVLRDTLLGVERILPFAAEQAKHWIPPGTDNRVRTLRQDIASLNDYDARLSDKVQFLLDATLGFISIEQNNTIKILTVVSVVGIPPTLVASIYGMNFKYMPELDWLWGYPWGLLLILLSAVIPLIVFRLKAWL